MALTTSDTGIALIKKFEGCKLTAYQDSAGVWTIGYGHTSGVKSGQTITQSQADAYLKSDLASAEENVNSFNSTYNWNQNQFDALVSFAFNIGSINQLTANGTRTIATISSKITAYNKAGGKVLQGLVNRRAAEKELFDTAVKPTTTTSSGVASSSSGSSSSATAQIKKATEPAKSGPSSSIKGTYKATGNLNVRNGAGKSKSVLVTIPKGTTVHCEGYYTTVSGVKWYYIWFNYNNIQYTGFASSQYLSKQ